MSNLVVSGNGSTLRFVPGTGNVTLTQFGGANVTAGLLAPHVFFGAGNSSNFAYHTGSAGGNVVRAPVYGTDAGFITSPAAGNLGNLTQANFNITGNIYCAACNYRQYFALFE